MTVSGIPSGSALWLAGDDYDNAISRTLLPGDTPVHQKLSSNGDTYWTQQQTAPASGTARSAPAPAGDQWNAVAVVIPPASQQQPPAAPTGLTAGTSTSSTVPLSWTAPGGTVTGYYVYRNGAQVANVTSETSYTDTGLTPSTQYSYTVAAYNGAGTGPQSSAVQATTQSGSGITLQPMMAALQLLEYVDGLVPNSIVPVGVFPAESLPANLAAEGINDDPHPGPQRHCGHRVPGPVQPQRQRHEPRERHRRVLCGRRLLWFLVGFAGCLQRVRG